MSEKKPRNRRRTVIGIVSSDKMQKTITVSVERIVQHPRFKKYIRRTTTFKAHDENGDAHVGDRVEIAETRPLSKTKSHRLVRVLERARLPGAMLEEDVPGVPETAGEEA